LEEAKAWRSASLLSIREGRRAIQITIQDEPMDKKEAKKELDRVLKLLDSDWLSDRSREELERRQGELLKIINQTHVCSR
jgi:hypothetical protein